METYTHCSRGLARFTTFLEGERRMDALPESDGSRLNSWINCRRVFATESARPEAPVRSCGSVDLALGIWSNTATFSVIHSVCWSSGDKIHILAGVYSNRRNALSVRLAAQAKTRTHMRGNPLLSLEGARLTNS